MRFALCRLDIQATLSHCSPLVFMVSWRSRPQPSSSCSLSRPLAVEMPCWFLPWAWASFSTSSVLSWRPTPCQRLHLLRPRLLVKRWQDYFISMCVFTRWVGGRFLGYTLPISSQRGHGTMGLQLQVLLNGSSVSSVFVEWGSLLNVTSLQIL